MGLNIVDGAVYLTAGSEDGNTAFAAIDLLIREYSEKVRKCCTFEETAKMADEADILLTLCRARRALFAD